MKYILILLFPMFAFGQCVTDENIDTMEVHTEISTDVPGHLKGATITITLADGSSSVVPAEKFKVVARKQQRILIQTYTKQVITCNKDGSSKKNILSGVVGHGITSGMDKDKLGNKTEVSTKEGVVGGLQYQRKITDSIVIGVQGQTNGTGSGIIGLEF